MDGLVGLMAKAPDYLVAISGIIASLTVLTALTPTKVDDAWFGKLTPMINMMLRGLNVGGLNIMKDQNKDDRK